MRTWAAEDEDLAQRLDLTAVPLSRLEQCRRYGCKRPAKAYARYHDYADGKLRGEAHPVCGVHLGVEKRKRKAAVERGERLAKVREENERRDCEQSIALSLARMLTEKFGVHFDAYRGDIALTRDEAAKLLGRAT